MTNTNRTRNLLAGIADRVSQGREDDPESGEVPVSAPGPFTVNLGGIANPRAPGQADATIQKTEVQRQVWVDPLRCRPWSHHNRAYDLLNQDRCADLIAGLRSLGRQQRPAIVRSLKGDARVGVDNQAHDFEIVSGVRRHWSVSWLRANGETNTQGEPYLYLVAVRDDLDDTAAFELSDAENRGQQDISDYERAREYRWALEHLYAGNASRMATAIRMDRSNLARLVALTEMPPEIVRAYPSILDIRTRHWRQLSPCFASKEREKAEAAERVLACARSIVQARAVHSRNVPSDGAQTATLLIAAMKERARGGDRTQVLHTVNAAQTGKLAVRIKRTTRGLTFDVPRASGATKDEIYTALRQAVEDYFEI